MKAAMPASAATGRRQRRSETGRSRRPRPSRACRLCEQAMSVASTRVCCPDPIPLRPPATSTIAFDFTCAQTIQASPEVFHTVLRGLHRTNSSPLDQVEDARQHDDHDDNGHDAPTGRSGPASFTPVALGRVAG